MCTWYLQQKRPDDVIVSASPAFLIKEFAQRLGVAYVASDVDIETGRYHKPACKGKEKVKQFRAVYPDAVVESSYGNAESDQYIMREGQHAYLVRNFSNVDADFQQWN
jgi:phosphoserine phosphatase